MNDVTVSGSYPVGTFEIEVCDNEMVDVDPRILMTLEERLREGI